MLLLSRSGLGLENCKSLLLVAATAGAAVVVAGVAIVVVVVVVDNGSVDAGFDDVPVVVVDVVVIAAVFCPKVIADEGAPVAGEKEMGIGAAMLERLRRSRGSMSSIPCL